MTAINLRLRPDMAAGQLISLPSYFGADDVPGFEAATNALFSACVAFVLLDAREVRRLDPAAHLAILDAADRAYSCGVGFFIAAGPELEPLLCPGLSTSGSAIAVADDIIGLAA